MNLHFRQATVDDLDQLLLLEASCFPDYQQSTRQQLKKGINSASQEVVVVEQAGKKKILLGSLVLFRYKYTLRLYSIALAEKFRGQNLGEQLMAYVKDYAHKNQFSQLLLEVSMRHPALIAWYEKQGFRITQELHHYYKPEEHAYKMLCDLKAEEDQKGYRNLIVIDQPFLWAHKDMNAAVISVKEYINNPRYQDNANFRVFNLCSSYKYQRYGYYISLLASARGQRIVPNIATLSDFKNIHVIQSVAFDVNALINKNLDKEPGREFTLDIYFGQTAQKSFKTLAAKLYQLFEAPMFRISFLKDERWLIKSVKILTFKTISEEHKPMLYRMATDFFNKKRYRYPSLTNYVYDIAVLVDPGEENPPSNPAALEKFRLAAHKKGVYLEFITKEDKEKINEFDALFVRETTNVNHHTYELSRLAFAEGLVVMDDPWSILRCSNKIFQHELFQTHKIRTPLTVAITKNNLTRKQLEGLNYPMVLKQPDSAFSLGVTKVHDVQEAEQQLKDLFKISDMVVCQEFLYSEYDWRIGILDNQALFACKYFMTKDHWQIYDWNSTGEEKAGAHETVSIEDVPVEVLKVAQKAASLIGDGLYGVDLKYLNGKVYVIEVNDNPNIDVGVEDSILNDELYSRIIDSFIRRIEIAKNIRKINLARPK